MTEEIIIDGVNVAGCDYYDAGRCQCLLDCSDNRDLCMRQINIDEDLCKDNPNCYYKQLKRLEQENKDFEILAKSLYKRIEELEKENEALAFRERLYKADYEASEQENKELKEENSLLSYNLHIKENEAAHYLKEVSRHRSALEEINRVVKLAYKVEDYLLGQDYTDLVNRIEKELEVLNEG